MNLIRSGMVSLGFLICSGGGALSADLYTPSMPDSYFSVFGGYTWPEDSGFNLNRSVYDTALDGGFTVGGAYGTYLLPNLRGEIELSYQHFSASSYTRLKGDPPSSAEGDVGIFNVTLNLWRDFDLGNGFVPYVGGGLGVGVADTSIDWVNSADGSSAGLAGQLGVGLRYAVGDHVTLDVGYRFRSLIDITSESLEDPPGFVMGSLNNHTVQAGLSYSMGQNGYIQPAAYFGSASYISLFGGVALPENTSFAGDYTEDMRHDEGFIVGGAVGTTLAPGLRAELEGSYIEYDQTFGSCCADTVEEADGEVSIGMVTANLWKHVNLGAFSPYVGAGVGLGVVDAELEPSDSEPVDGTGIGLALQFGTGVRYSISDALALDLGYRLRGIYGITLSAAEDGDDHANVNVLTHTLQAGVTYSTGGLAVEPVADVDPARSDFYLTAFGGAVLPVDWIVSTAGRPQEVNIDTGFIVGGAVGTHILDTVRGELELAYSEADQCGYRRTPIEEDCNFEANGGSNLSYVSVMANAWKDFQLGIFTPYVGGGIGMAFIDPDIDKSEEYRDDSFAMAAQVGAGVRFAVTEQLSVDAGYRFKALMAPVLSDFSGDTSNDHSVGTHYSHNIISGLSWSY